MCEPVSIGTIALSASETLMMGISAFSAVTGYFAQQDQADAMAASQKVSYEAQMQSLKLQQEQVNEQASDQMSARAMQAQAAQARLRVAAGESGVSGVSVDRDLSEIDQAEAQDIASIDKNRRNTINQTEVNGQAIQAQTQSAINSVKQPSWLGAGLQIAGTAAGIASKQPNNKGATQSPTSGAQWVV